jgi:hypothetical protein
MQAPPPRKVSGHLGAHLGAPLLNGIVQAIARCCFSHCVPLPFFLSLRLLLLCAVVFNVFSRINSQKFSRKLEFGSWICAGNSGRSSSAKPQVCFSECDCQHWVRTRILSTTTPVLDCGSAANSRSYIVGIETKSARLLLSLISRSSVLAGIYRSLPSKVSRDRNSPASIHISTYLY